MTSPKGIQIQLSENGQVAVRRSASDVLQEQSPRGYGPRNGPCPKVTSVYSIPFQPFHPQALESQVLRTDGDRRDQLP